MKKILGLMALAIMSMPFTARAEMLDGVEISRPAQGINFTQSIDVSRYDTLGVQAVYSDGTPSSHTLTSGTREVSTVTVTSNFSALISTQARVFVCIQSTTSVLGDSVTLAGTVFTEGTDWFASGISSSAAAIQLKNRIDAHPDFVATTVGSTVTVRWITVGTSGNGLPVSSSDASNLQISSTAFLNGVAQETLTISGVTLTEGVDFRAVTSSAVTAAAIATAINANTSLNTVFVASITSSSLIAVSARYPGTLNNYIMSSSTNLGTIGFNIGLTTDLDLVNDIITKTSHGLTTGLAVQYKTESGTAIGGLTTATTYFAIKLTENTYKLATSTTLAVAGTAIDLSTVPATVSSYGMIPAPLVVGLAGFHWQASNDGTNFSNLSVSSVTYSAADTTLWDFGSFAYRYLRMLFIGPTRGGITVTTTAHGREE